MLAIASSCSAPPAATEPTPSPSPRPAPFLTCPTDTIRRGYAPPLSTQLWCERADRTLHGPWITWYDSGQMKTRGGYDRGQKTGLWERWHETGRIAERGRYQQGQPVGPQKRWNQHGQRLVLLTVCVRHTPSGFVVPRSRVTVLDVGARRSHSRTTDHDGIAAFDLTSGAYRVLALDGSTPVEVEAAPVSDSPPPTVILEIERPLFRPRIGTHCPDP